MSERPLSWLVIERGWTVTASDGSEIGRVDQVVGDENADIFDGLAVSRRVLSPAVYVPAEQVAAITPGRVQLTIGLAEADRLGPYEEAPAPERILPETASAAERIVGWLRRLVGRGP